MCVAGGDYYSHPRTSEQRGKQDRTEQAHTVDVLRHHHTYWGCGHSDCILCLLPSDETVQYFTEAVQVFQH